VKLSDAKGKFAVVYFYPRDNTPGCTREAQAFSKAAKAFTKAGAVVYGISKDSVESHRRFASQCDLTIDLLSDPDLATHKTYGAYGEKIMYGKKTLGTIRSTFIVDPTGKIARVFPRVKVDGHVEAVLEAIAELQGGGPSKASAPKATARSGKR
jgi:thioredoxin-dependent peroxiredoxin